ncbi:MAG: GGDEF domain-containing protein [Clostridiaceae bacterium]|nr:GGDEF domain-containing protein [Clostridiaceae bacterium]
MEKDKAVVDFLLSECDRQVSEFTGKECVYAQKALELSTLINYDIGIYESRFRLARSLVSNNTEQAIKHLLSCYSIAQTLDDKQRIARAANSLGIAYYNLGITSKSLDSLLEALDISKANGYVDIECRVYNNICNILTELGDYETTLKYLFNLLQKCDVDGKVVFPKSIAYRNLANTYYNMESLKEAEHYANLALNEATENYNPQILCEANYILGQIRTTQKRLDEARSLLLCALNLAEKTLNDYYMVQIRIDLAKLYCELNNPDIAFATIKDAYNLAFQLDNPVLKRNTALTMIDICELTNNQPMLIEALTAFKNITLVLEKENLKNQQNYTKSQLLLFNLKKDNERLRAEVERDPLTGCLSSRTFPGRILQALSTYGQKGALVFMDIDNLKVVNDTYGHDAGDELLKSFARDLMDVMPKESLKIRIAGDEFIVFIPNVGIEETTQALDKLIKVLSVPRPIGKTKMPVLLSAGIALYPEHSSDLINLRKMADAAMYSAKQAGRGKYKIYSTS